MLNICLRYCVCLRKYFTMLARRQGYCCSGSESVHPVPKLELSQISRLLRSHRRRRLYRHLYPSDIAFPLRPRFASKFVV